MHQRTIFLSNVLQQHFIISFVCCIDKYIKNETNMNELRYHLVTIIL